MITRRNIDEPWLFGGYWMEYLQSVSRLWWSILCVTADTRKWSLQSLLPWRHRYPNVFGEVSIVFLNYIIESIWLLGSNVENILREISDGLIYGWAILRWLAFPWRENLFGIKLLFLFRIVSEECSKAEDFFQACFQTFSVLKVETSLILYYESSQNQSLKSVQDKLTFLSRAQFRFLYLQTFK